MLHLLYVKYRILQLNSRKKYQSHEITYVYTWYCNMHLIAYIAVPFQGGDNPESQMVVLSSTGHHEQSL